MENYGFERNPAEIDSRWILYQFSFLSSFHADFLRSRSL